MVGKREMSEDVYGMVPQRLRDMVKACAVDKQSERMPHRRSILERSVVKQPPYLDLVTGEGV